MIRNKVCLKKGNRNITQNSNLENSANNDNLMREFYYLREFRQHPHITKLYEIIFTESSVYMILEYYPSGDLFEYVTKNGHLTVDESLRIFTQLVGAVYYLHKSGCCHRDLKLENVLLDKQLDVKLSDFGFTRELPFAQYGKKSLLSEYCGTGAYMAPELVQRIPYSGIKIDIWALGVMFYTMITGEMPFDDSLDAKDLEYAIIHNKPKYLENLETLNDKETDKLQEIKFLLNGLLSKDAEDRISSLEDVLKMPLIIQYGGEYEISIVNKLHFDESNNKDFTTIEKSLFKRMVAAGIDSEILKCSIQQETLDSVYGLWALLKDEMEKKDKRKSRKNKRKSKSMLKLTSSRSIIGNARQAFSASPSQSIENIPVVSDNEVNGLPNLMSRTGSSNTTGVIANENSIIRTASFKKVRNLVMGQETPKRHNSINNNSIADSKIIHKNKNSLDQISLLSKNTQNSSSSRSKKKKAPHFSFFNIFKSKKSHDEKNKNKTLENDSTLYKVTTNSTVPTSSTAPKELEKGLQNSMSLIQNKSVKENPELKYVNASDDDILMTPDNSRLKRSEPTRPVSMLSTFSNHTSISETSNGSGYITGYSTDNNALCGSSTVNMNNGLNINNDLYQSIYSPHAPARPKFSRGVSEWSVNISSQAESPNSSFTALSRTNSIDSLSRSISSRKKTDNKGMTFARRGRSPLNSKVNAKWTPNTLMMKKKPFLKQDKSQIIEEESSEEDDNDGDNDDDRVINTFTGQNVMDKKTHNVSRRPSRLYMRKGSIKFPSLPVTEEDDDSHDAEDEADLDDDEHDYDDVATENSLQVSNKQLHSSSVLESNSNSNSNLSNTLFTDSLALSNSDIRGMVRSSSLLSDNSLDNDDKKSVSTNIFGGNIVSNQNHVHNSFSNCYMNKKSSRFPSDILQNKNNFNVDEQGKTGPSSSSSSITGSTSYLQGQNIGDSKRNLV